MLSVTHAGAGGGRHVWRGVELDSIDERSGVAEQGSDAVAHRLRVGVERALGGRSACDKQPVHAPADVGRHHLHASADIRRTLCGFALSRLFEGAHR